MAALHSDEVSRGQRFEFGANQGEFTVFAASLVGPSGKVLAFEPVSKIRERLTLNISLNSFQNVDVHALGLGDKSEVNVPIFDSHETFRDGTMHEGLFSLYVHHLESEEIAEHIAIITLDEICSQLGKRVKLIKLDIEGAEAAALRGRNRQSCATNPVLFSKRSQLLPLPNQKEESEWHLI